MDDLTFRKKVLADPFSKDKALLDAAKHDASKQRFWDEIQAMEADVKMAMEIPVPAGLEQTLLAQPFNQQTQVKEQPHVGNLHVSDNKGKRPWYLALAASVVFASVLTVGMLSTRGSNLSNDLFVHMSHVDAELMGNTNPVDVASINDKLASFSGHINDGLGNVLSAKYCYLDKIKSLHLIIQSENGLTSLFVMPKSVTPNLKHTFSKASYQGASFLLNSANVIVLGSNESDVQALETRAKQVMTFAS